MSIRWGTSSGFSKREKLLLVTGTALTRANSATPQLVVGDEMRERFGQQCSKARDIRGYHTHAHARTRTLPEGCVRATPPPDGSSPLAAAAATSARPRRLLPRSRT